jgi:8-oxo-dGTP diphosphatase
MINQKPNVHQMVVCANVFIRKDGKYLMMKRSADKKYAPNKIHPYGGKVDKNENPLDAAIREVKEEAGVDIKNVRLEAVILELTDEKDLPVNWLIFYFSADYAGGEVKKTEEGKAVYLTDEEIKKSDLFPSVKKAINNILNPDDGVVFSTNKYHGFESGIVELSKNVCVVK